MYSDRATSKIARRTQLWRHVQMVIIRALRNGENCKDSPDLDQRKEKQMKRYPIEKYIVFALGLGRAAEELQNKMLKSWLTEKKTRKIRMVRRDAKTYRTKKWCSYSGVELRVSRWWWWSSS